MLTSIIAKIGIWNAWIFMSVFILQMIIILFANQEIRGRTHATHVVRKTFIEKYISIIANICWLIALIYSVFLPLRVNTIWFYIGCFVFILGVSFLSIATYNFMKTPVNQSIQKGMYRLSRHPMYLATFLICFATGIAAISYLFIVLSTLIMISFHFEALVEERDCLDKYKAQYEAYMDAVPRWFGLPR